MSDTLTSTINWLTGVADSIAGIEEFTYFEKASDVNADQTKSYPALLIYPRTPDSTLSSHDLNIGRAFETYNFTFELRGNPKSFPAENTTLTGLYDTLQGYMMSFLWSLCSVEYKDRFQLNHGTNDIPLTRYRGAGNDNTYSIKCDVQIRAFVGTSVYTASTTCPGASLYYGNGSLYTTVASGGSHTVAAVSVLDGSGETVSFPYAASFSTSQRTFTTTATLRALSSLETAIKMDSQGTVKSVSLTNVSSFTVKRVRAGAITTVSTGATLTQFTVQKDDIIHISATPTNSALDCVLVFTGFHDVLTGSITQPASNGDERYLYVLNYVDQTVSVIDCDDHSIEATITLPVGFSFSATLYRGANKTRWFFGNNRYAIVDANPASGTFNTVLSSGAISINSSISGCCWDYINDVIYVGSSNPQVSQVIPDTLAVTDIGTTAGISPQRSTSMYFIAALKAVFLGDPQNSQLIISTETLTPIYGFGQPLIGNMVYSFANGKIYHASAGSIIVRQSNPIKQIAAISQNATNRSGICLVPSLNKAFACSATANSVGVIDTSTDTNITDISKGSPATNESSSRGIVYSAYSNRVYVQGAATGGQTTGVNKIHIFNPTNNTYQGSITVGNMDADSGHGFWTHQMGLNKVLL